MSKKLFLSITILSVLLVTPAIGRQKLYRWLDPETGNFVTTPTEPPYPIKKSREGANLPGIDFYNVDLDMDAPQVKAVIEKRKALKAEEQRKEQERVEREAQRKQAEEKYQERIMKESAEERERRCKGPLSFGVQIGMNKEQVIFCMGQLSNGGRPDRVNTTITAIGQREQWVYEMSGENWYFYFVGDILVTVQQ
ncbi:MAG: hypothetical protein H6974_12855 [Gammaproteobacteria bacterium]|nr:hypothetical protein [Gammaproteobacteria bacterium]